MVDLKDERNGSNGSETGTSRLTSVPLNVITQKLRSVLSGVVNKPECRNLNQHNDVDGYRLEFFHSMF